MSTFFMVILIVVTCGFTFTNGFNDGCSVVASIISSHSMEPKKAVAMAAITEFISPIIFVTLFQPSVAATIGKGIVANTFIQSKGMNTAYIFVFCAMLGAITWNLVAWGLAIPSSSSHALVGGLVGSGVSIFGIHSVLWHNVIFKIILILFITPVLGMIIGFMVNWLTNYICKNCTSKVNKFFKVSQAFSVVLLAFNHSINDSQKSMGIIALILTISGVQSHFYLPFWVKVLSSGVIAMGIYLGGWRIIKTVGRGIFTLKPMHSFVSQISSASIIFASGLLGAPVSTSQIISSSIMGIGASEKVNAVKWNIAKNILTTWFTTIPAAALISSLTYFLILHL